ncbi:hypothetical protein Tco_0009145 [Tanacetum coccineum]
MFDEYFEPPCVERLVPLAPSTQVPVISAGTPSSITIDQDAPSISYLPSLSVVQPPISHQGVAVGPTIKDNPFAQADNDPFVNMFAPEPSSDESSSGDVIEPKNVKTAMDEACWFEAMQEEIHEFDRLQIWELVPKPDYVMIICDNHDLSRNWLESYNVFRLKPMISPTVVLNIFKHHFEIMRYCTCIGETTLSLIQDAVLLVFGRSSQDLEVQVKMEMEITLFPGGVLFFKPHAHTLTDVTSNDLWKSSIYMFQSFRNSDNQSPHRMIQGIKVKGNFMNNDNQAFTIKKV